MERLQEEFIGRVGDPRQARSMLCIYVLLAISFILTIGLFTAVLNKSPGQAAVPEPVNRTRAEFIALKQTADALLSREEMTDSRLTRDISQLNSKVDAISSQTKKMESDLTMKLNQAADKAEAASSNTKKMEGKLNTEILNLKNTVSELSLSITSLTGVQNSLKQKISQLSPSTGTLDLTVIQNDLTEVKKEIANLKTAVSSLGPQILQWMPFKEKLYLVTSHALSWQKAKSWCESQNAKLVVITSVEEQAFIKETANNQRLWIGLSDIVKEGDWRWVDGTDYQTNVKFWTPGEPNNIGEEDCAHVWNNGMWNDVPCSLEYKFICQKAA